jgi:hypothetical protein
MDSRRTFFKQFPFRYLSCTMKNTKSIILEFLCIFGLMTIINDFPTALGYNGLYIGNPNKYVIAALNAITIIFLKQVADNQRRMPSK